MSTSTVSQTALRAVLAPFTATWLRSRCGCSECHDPVGGQRLVDLTDIPFDTEIGELAASEANITVTSMPDGHHACGVPEVGLGH